MKQGIYSKPGGYRLFLDKTKELKKKYQQTPGKGLQVTKISLFIWAGCYYNPIRTVLPLCKRQKCIDSILNRNRFTSFRSMKASKLTRSLHSNNVTSYLLFPIPYSPPYSLSLSISFPLICFLQYSSFSASFVYRIHKHQPLSIKYLVLLKKINLGFPSFNQFLILKNVLERVSLSAIL